MTLIKGLRATTIWKAFLVNAIASALIIVLSITLKQVLDKYFPSGNGGGGSNDDKNSSPTPTQTPTPTPKINTTNSPSPSNKNPPDDNPLKWESIILTIIVTFIATYGAYWLLYWLFGYGGGMLTSTPVS